MEFKSLTNIESSFRRIRLMLQRLEDGTAAPPEG